MASIDLNSIQPNSHKYKEEQKKVSMDKKDEREKMTPVVKEASVVSVKKPLSQKFIETFVPEDVSDVKSYVIMDVIVPGIKNTVLDVLEMMFFGEPRGRKKKSYYGGGKETVSYNTYYRNGSSERPSRSRDNYREYGRDDKLDYRSIILRDRVDAEEVIDQMRRRIREYGAASIADLFDLIDVTGRYTDNNWGWTDERDIGMRRVSKGYLIDVPEAEFLD